MTIAFYCVLIAALMPYAVFGPASAKLDIRLPRKNVGELDGAAARAYGAHLNHFEAFPFFAAAVIIAHLAAGAGAITNWLAVGFIAVRAVYTFAYLTDRQPLRSGCFGLGALLCIAIFLSPLVR